MQQYHQRRVDVRLPPDLIGPGDAELGRRNIRNLRAQLARPLRATGYQLTTCAGRQLEVEYRSGVLPVATLDEVILSVVGVGRQLAEDWASATTQTCSSSGMGPMKVTTDDQGNEPRTISDWLPLSPVVQ